MKSIVILLIIGLVACQKFDDCFNELRKLSTDRQKADNIEEDQISQFLEQLERTMSGTIELQNVCKSFFEYFKQFDNDLVTYHIGFSKLRLAKIEETRGKFRSAFAKKEEQAATLVFYINYFISDFQIFISGIAKALDYAFWENTYAPPCSRAVITAMRTATREDVDLESAVKEVVSAFEQCKDQKRKPPRQNRRYPDILKKLSEK
eukprot:TRINITY_DN10463_c0_g1_i6.p1 TRINITY_DN10463_c0_g1~~TRINITY_DN10463_c0_g1_i6.p1  ORF type:complete len:206 (-),score=39.66 TRINITY_DN10463_c0_g1_i6:139-756(-)